MDFVIVMWYRGTWWRSLVEGRFVVVGFGDAGDGRWRVGPGSGSILITAGVGWCATYSNLGNSTTDSTQTKGYMCTT